MEQHDLDSQESPMPIVELCERFSVSLDSFSTGAIGSTKFRSAWRVFKTTIRNRMEDIMHPERHRVLGILEGTKKELEKKTSPESIDDVLSQIKSECARLLDTMDERKDKRNASKIDPQEQIWKDLKPAQIPTRLRFSLFSFIKSIRARNDIEQIKYLGEEVLLGIEYYNRLIDSTKLNRLLKFIKVFIKSIELYGSRGILSSEKFLSNYHTRAEKLREKSLDTIRSNEQGVINEKELDTLRKKPLKEVLSDLNRRGGDIRDSLIKGTSGESQFDAYFRTLSVCEEKVHNMPFFEDRVLLEVGRMAEALKDSSEHSIRYQRLLARLPQTEETKEPTPQTAGTPGEFLLTPVEHHEERLVEKTMIRSARKDPETNEQAQIKRLSTGVRDAFDAYTNTILSFIDNEEYRDSLLARNAQTEKVTTALKNFLNSILSFRGRLENTFCKKHLRKVLDQLESFERECVELLRAKGMGKKDIFYNLLMSYISGWKKLFVTPEVADIERTDKINTKREPSRGHGRQPRTHIVRPRITKTKSVIVPVVIQEPTTTTQKPPRNTKKIGNPILTEQEWLQIKEIWSRLPHSRFDEISSITDLERFIEEVKQAKDLLGVRKRKTNIKDSEVDTISRSIRYITSELKKQLKKQLDKVQRIENPKKIPAEGQNKARSSLRDIEAKLEPFVVQYHQALEAFNTSARASKKSEQHIAEARHFLEVLVTCIEYWKSERITRIHTSAITCKVRGKSIKYTVPSIETLEEKFAVCSDRLVQLGIEVASVEGI